jgi:TQXA domain-containing protein/LPXTG-motif cell wall-anchored protein
LRGERFVRRTAAAVLGGSIALASGAVPASADQATGNARPFAVDGYTVDVGKNAATGLIDFDLDGEGSLKVYCVQIEEDISHSRKMVETPWDSFPDPESPFHGNRDRINWVLHHGYPAVDVEDLAKAVTESGAPLADELSRKEAVTATQAAIWHFSDGMELNQANPLPENDTSDADVRAVYNYLVSDENNAGIGEQPIPALQISPADASADAGELVGPFIVRTTGEITEIETDLPEGVSVTDAEGNELAADGISDGTEIYLDVPEDVADGEGSFGLTASAHLDTGRLFVVRDYDKAAAQSVIVAASDKTTLSAQATGSWVAAPVEETTPPAETTTPPVETTAPSTEATTGTSANAAPQTTGPSVKPQANEQSLAHTGVSMLTPLLLGAGLLVVGAVTLLLVRRRRTS